MNYITAQQVQTLNSLVATGHKILSVSIHTENPDGNMIVTEEVEEIKGVTGTILQPAKDPVHVYTGYYTPDGTHLGRF